MLAALGNFALTCALCVTTALDMIFGGLITASDRRYRVGVKSKRPLETLNSVADRDPQEGFS